MEFSTQFLDKNEEFENQCFACLGTEDLIENQGVLEVFTATFNFELKTEDFHPFLCINCHQKLNDAVEFLAQVRNSLQYFQDYGYRKKDEQNSESKQQTNIKKEEKINIKLKDEANETLNDDTQEDTIVNDSNEESSNSDSDNEPLIKFVQTKKHKKNTFNPKLEKIPLEIIEETLDDYREQNRMISNCILCDFKGLNIRNLSCHMIFKHREAKSHWCLRCNKIVENIETHKKTHTNKEWCRFCHKNISKCHYLEHLKAHAGFEYTCPECPKKFISQKTLDEHMARHRQQTPFQCHLCNKAFKLFNSLQDHILTHGRYRCEVCEKNFEIPELLASHLCSGKVVKKCQFSATKSEDYVEENSEEFDENKNLEELKACQAEKKYFDWKGIKNEGETIKVPSDIQVESLTCHFCQRTYKTAYKLQKHIEGHMGIFLTNCQYCGKGFSSRADMANHERVHTKEKPFICSTCGKGFVSGATLRIHMKQHTGKPEECDLCNKRFCRKSELKLHLQKHRGERPFLCTDCGKSFAQKSHLTCHLTQHSDERPYNCMKCEKAFKKKELLKHHMKLHGEKSFKCTICFYECHKKYRLQQHMKMHEGKTGIKLNSCQLCSRGFSSVQLLNIHMGNVHNVIV
ncbi:unnamed protein product [Ceutorhynchus assimilis]|uniref:Zinc finger protein n=1 Tax=Ceutorhynchus assimilis TaxID=467358 RepID=A0A9N9QL92_9CUCU|nr:unnamed protein product [Ceutorhynchus assimilis]